MLRVDIPIDNRNRIDSIEQRLIDTTRLIKEVVDSVYSLQERVADNLELIRRLTSIIDKMQQRLSRKKV